MIRLLKVALTISLCCSLLAQVAHAQMAKAISTASGVQTARPSTADASIINARPSTLTGFDDEQSAIRKLRDEARRAARRGQYEKVIEIYQALTEQKDTQALLAVAFAYYKLQNYRSAFEHANRVIQSNPNNARAHALVAAAMLRSGFVNSAVEEVNQAFKLDPKEALAFGIAAEIDYYEGRIEQARARALKAYSLDDNESDYLLTIARSASRLDLFAEAALAYERFLQIAPETDRERRDRIRALITFYRKLADTRVHEVSGPQISQAAFTLGADHRPYLKLRVNGREANFVIDTGAGFTIISDEMAKRFGIREVARGGHSQGFGGTGRFPIVYGLIKTLEVGEIKVRSVPCFIRHFAENEEKAGADKVDGFIGLSVLGRFITELDYQSKVIRMDRNIDQPLATRSEQATVIPFRTTENGLISIEAELDGDKRINAILDSAASSTVISAAAIERLNMRDSLIKGQTIRVIGAAGVSDNVELVYIRNCRVANFQKENLRALILDFGAINETAGFEQSGILGGDFLRHFRLIIDFARGQIVLQPYTAAVTKQ